MEAYLRLVTLKLNRTRLGDVGPSPRPNGKEDVRGNRLQGLQMSGDEPLFQLAVPKLVDRPQPA